MVRGGGTPEKCLVISVTVSVRPKVSLSPARVDSTLSSSSRLHVRGMPRRHAAPVGPAVQPEELPFPGLLTSSQKRRFSLRLRHMALRWPALSSPLLSALRVCGDPLALGHQYPEAAARILTQLQTLDPVSSSLHLVEVGAEESADERGLKCAA